MENCQYIQFTIKSNFVPTKKINGHNEDDAVKASVNQVLQCIKDSIFVKSNTISITKILLYYLSSNNHNLYLPWAPL